jgi:hypothetical protein
MNLNNSSQNNHPMPYRPEEKCSASETFAPSTPTQYVALKTNLHPQPKYGKNNKYMVCWIFF